MSFIKTKKRIFNFFWFILISYRTKKIYKPLEGGISKRQSWVYPRGRAGYIQVCVYLRGIAGYTQEIEVFFS